jgi:hypothetical protein
MPSTYKDEPQKWGLDGKKVWIPQGILIPCTTSDIWYLKIRRPRGKSKYIQIRGGKPALFMSQTLEFNQIAIFTEGEFDSLLLWQAIEDLAAVVTTGSATNTFCLSTWGFNLLHIQQFLTAYDNDKAGKKGRKKLDFLNPRHLEIPQIRPHDKDITDFHKSGGNLRKWFTDHALNRSEATRDVKQQNERINIA